MESAWFGDTRLVRTAVADGPDSDEPVYLPEDPAGCDRVKRLHGTGAFYCGRHLGGCGEPLKARTYYDRVCHFAHHGREARRCRRPASGEDGADHLFIGRELSRWLDSLHLPHRRPEYELDDRGRAEAVVVRLESDRVVHVQLSSRDPERWERRRRSILAAHSGSAILCAPLGSLRQREVSSAGRALLIWCVTQGDLRKVVVDLFQAGRKSNPRALSEFRFDDAGGIVPRNRSASPLRLAGRSATLGHGEACTRYRADGAQCDRLTAAPDRWCRGPGCSGFRTPEPMAEARARYLTPPSEGDSGTRLVLDDAAAGRVRATGSAANAFRSKHGGNVQEAAVELHAMLRPLLDRGVHYRMPDGTWILDHEGFRLILNEKGDNITGYDSMHAERSFAQFEAGVPSRIGNHARAQRRSLQTPMADGDFPDRLDPDAACRLRAEQFAVTAEACRAYEKLTDSPAAKSDQDFIKALYGALDAGLRTGDVVDDGERLILYGKDAWWVLAVDEPAVLAVHHPGTRALAPRPEPEPEPVDPEPAEADAEHAEAGRPDLAEFEAIVSERIQDEREDDLHEEIRHGLISSLKKRSRLKGGTARDDTYIDAWYESEEESVVFEVLETGGFTYADFRKAAVNLMEVTYLHTAGKGAHMVVVAAEPPGEPWIPNTLLNVFGIHTVWQDGNDWAGPGRGLICVD